MVHGGQPSPASQGSPGLLLEMVCAKLFRAVLDEARSQAFQGRGRAIGVVVRSSRCRVQSAEWEGGTRKDVGNTTVRPGQISDDSRLSRC